MKKRIIAFGLAVVSVMVLTACGSGKDSGASPSMGAYDAESCIYTNEFLGMQCELDESWEVFDSEQIADLQGVADAYASDEELSKQLSEEGAAQLFYAQEESGLTTLNIALEDLGAVYGSLLNEEQYAQKGMEQVEPALEGVGFSDISTEITSMDFAGGKHTAIEVYAKLQDVEFYEVMVCVKVDKYMALITAGSYMTDGTEDILNSFSSLKSE